MKKSINLLVLPMLLTLGTGSFAMNTQNSEGRWQTPPRRTPSGPTLSAKKMKEYAREEVGYRNKVFQEMKSPSDPNLIALRNALRNVDRFEKNHTEYYNNLPFHPKIKKWIKENTRVH